MKKYIIIVLALVLFQKRSDISAYFNPPPDYGRLHNGEVILYATSWCGYCAKARKFLREKDIAYHEYDIETSAEGKDQYLSLGVSGVPVLLVNGNVVRGYNPSQIVEYLK